MASRAEEKFAKSQYDKINKLLNDKPKKQQLCTPDDAARFDEMFTATVPATDFIGKLQNARARDENGYTSQVNAYKSAKNGDPIAFDALDPVLKNVLATLKMKELMDKKTLENPNQLLQLPPEDKAIRLGLSRAMATKGGFAGKGEQFFEDAMEQRRRLLSEEEMKGIEDDFLRSPTDEAKKLRNTMVEQSGGQKIPLSQAYTNALAGVYSSWANLPPYLQDVISTKKMNQEKANGNFSSPEKTESLNAHDPALRLGLNLAGNTPGGFDGKNKEFFKNADAKMTQKVFEKTFEPATKEGAILADKPEPLSSFWKSPLKWIQNHTIFRKSILKESQESKNDMLARNEYSQRVMLKMMYAGQIGDPKIIDDKKEKDSFAPNISDMFTTGVRTGIILPGTNALESEQAIEAIYGPNRGQDLGNVKRLAATHGVKRPSLDGKEPYEELKLKGPGLDNPNLSALRNQYGINIAAGGLGNKGTDNKTIKNKGNCGHLYSHIAAGDNNNKGVLLVGLESDAPGKGNYEGHTHSSAAISETTSCFGTQKTSTVGDKYGGRVIDASGVNVKEFTQKMNTLDEYMKKNYEAARDTTNPGKQKQAKENIKNLTSFITEKQKTKDDVQKFEALVKEGKDIPTPAKIKSMSIDDIQKPTPNKESKKALNGIHMNNEQLNNEYKNITKSNDSNAPKLPAKGPSNAPKLPAKGPSNAPKPPPKGPSNAPEPPAKGTSNAPKPPAKPPRMSGGRSNFN